MLGLGLVATVAGACDPAAKSSLRTPTAAPPEPLPPTGASPGGPPAMGAGGATAVGGDATTSSTSVEAESRLASAHGRAKVYSHAPKQTQQIALTVDDGYCQPCAERYVQFAERSGIHITFSPNGVYRDIWVPLASTLWPLIEAGQVQIGNHTYNHSDLLRLSDQEIRKQIEKNDAWIETAFGCTARPWFRPPYGFHDERTDALAASLGYTNILMWSGSFGDSALLTPAQLMAQARRWLQPGTIMLGHANHMTVTQLFGQIEDLIAERNLEPVTLNEMFGLPVTTG